MEILVYAFWVLTGILLGQLLRWIDRARKRRADHQLAMAIARLQPRTEQHRRLLTRQQEDMGLIQIFDDVSQSHRVTKEQRDEAFRRMVAEYDRLGAANSTSGSGSAYESHPKSNVLNQLDRFGSSPGLAPQSPQQTEAGQGSASDDTTPDDTQT